MKKTLIALAVLGAAAGVAHAQSNVTIYGVVDTGYIKETGRDVRMGENINNRIGFRGSEDLGNGLKATFELEKRFDLYDGSIANTNQAQYKGSKSSNASGKDWDGAANIGLASNTWGRIRFGRVNELTTETIRKFDPFYQYGVGSMIMSTQRSARIDNTARYDSPKWAGFSFGLSYSLGGDTKDDWVGDHVADGVVGRDFNWFTREWENKEGKIDNDGYGINLSYDNYGFLATANWSRLADSNDSSVWNIGIGYKFGPARVTLVYEKTKDKGFKNGRSTWSDRGIPNVNPFDGDWGNAWGNLKSEQEVWLLGLEWDIGPGQLDASVQYGSLDDVKHLNGTRVTWTTPNPFNAVTGVDTHEFKDRDILKYAIGYTYNLSKRTSAYAQVSYTDYDEKDAGRFYTGMDRDSVTAIQVGMTHKF